MRLSHALKSLAAATLAMAATLVAAQQPVLNLYSARHYQTDEALYANFTQATGIRINRIDGDDNGILSRLKSEGAASPADVVLLVDAARLWRAENDGLFQPVKSAVLTQRIPATLRSSDTGNGSAWYGFSTRARVIVYDKMRVRRADVDTYADLAAPANKGRLCTRSGSHPYNVSLFGSMLERMGYDVELLPLDDASTIFDDGALRYEFVVLPFVNHGGFWTTWTEGAGKPIGRIMKGETAMPLFCVGVYANNHTQLLAALGAGVTDAAAYRKLLWRGATWYMPHVSAYTVVIRSHMSNYAVWQTDSEGGTTGWLYKGARGWVYVSSGNNHPGECNSLPFMLAEAIMRGHIAPPPRKLAAVVDVDDMPACDGVNGIMTLADVQRVYAAMAAMQMPNSWGIRPEDISSGRQSAAISNFVAQHSADRGGLIYPIVHNGNWHWKNGTKTVKDGLYRADIATVTGAGIPVGDDAGQLNAWGYTYANQNSWDEESHQLGQPGSDYTASPDGFTSRMGYGWRVCRLDALSVNNTKTIGEPEEVHGQTWYRGTRLVASRIQLGSGTLSQDFDDGGAGRSDIVFQCARFIRFTFCYGMPFYIHGQNCYQAPTGDAPGTRWLELLAGVHAAGLSNVVQYVHGATLADE